VSIPAIRRSPVIYYVDIDGVICTDAAGKYEEVKPVFKNIEKINRLYDQGNEVILWTARGTVTKIDWRELTEKQLAEWGVKYHELKFGKPYYDIIVDDKAVHVNDLE
jgi:CMP-N,N'-diacetyllegionaminic acid synthase